MLPRSIEIVIFPDVQVLDVTGPLQVFASANEFNVLGGGRRPYRVRVVSERAGEVRCSAGLVVLAEGLPAHDEAVNTVVVAGGAGVHSASGSAVLIGWLQSRSAAADRVVSICTGAFLLGAAGLLDGRRATTHWMQCNELARRFPDAKVEPDSIFVQDERLWSSAGVTAGIDLGLALVERDLGREIAMLVARDLVVYLRRAGGQSQYSAALAMQGSGSFADLHAWMIENLNGDLSLRRLADKCSMSERTFSRRYAAEVGVTPARAVERMRVENARSLLERTRISVAAVGRRCGFKSEEAFRRSFLRHLGVSPRSYRKHWSS